MRQITIGIAWFFAGFVIAIGATALSSGLDLEDGKRPFRIDVGAGQCKFKERDSVFWQSYHPHSLGLTSKCGEIGISADINHKVGWFLRYVPMGFTQVHALAQTFLNDDYANANHDPAVLTRGACKPAFNGDNCLYQWNSAGNMNGFALGATVNAYRSAGLQVDTEVGMLFYELKWNAQVHPLGCADACAWRVEVKQYSSRERTPMFGLTARWKVDGAIQPFVGWRLYLHSSDHTKVAAPHSGPVHQLVAGISF